MTSMFSWGSRYPTPPAVADPTGSLSYYLMRAIEQLVVFSIPAFIFVSGYFAAFLSGRHSIGMHYKQTLIRIKGLLIPYLLWTILFLFLGIIEGKNLQPDRLLINFLTGDTTPAYYYVPLIIQLYLVAPFLIPLAKKNWRILLITTGILQIFIHLPVTLTLLGYRHEWIISLPQIPKWLFISRLFWFSAGIVIGIHYSQIKAFVFRHARIWKISSLLLYFIGFLEWEILNGSLQNRETITDFLFGLAVLLSFISIGEKGVLPFSKALNFLGSKSYGLYLAHVPVMEIVARGIYHFAPWLLPFPLLFYLVIFLTGIGVPLLVIQIISSTNKLKPLYVYLFG